MHISVFGILWFSAIIFCFFKPIEYFIYLLLFSTVFQASYVVVIGGFDINATILTCVALIINCLMRNKFVISLPHWGRLGLVYVLFAFAISIIAPMVFVGTVIKGITNSEYDFHKFHTVVVSFSAGNISQPLTMIIYMITAIFLYNNRDKIKYKQLLLWVQRIFFFVFIVGIVHIVFMYFHLPLDWMKLLLHNESDITGATFLDFYFMGNFAKFMSTFYEPSYCGAYLAIMLMSFLNCDIPKKKITIICCVIGLLLNLTSTGLITMFVCGAILLIRTLSKSKIKRKTWNLFFITSAIFLLVLASFSNLRNFLYSFTLGKVGSGSFELRTMVDQIALDHFFNSNLVGLGLNSVQAYSLIPSLLAQIGLVGTFLFIAFIISIHKQIKNQNSNIKLYLEITLISVLVAQVLSIQALNFCLFWFVIFETALLIKPKKLIKVAEQY